MNIDNIYLGRQPILDRKKSLLAFELLFRDSSETNVANVNNDFVASSVVMRYVLSEFGINPVLGGQLGFINCDAELLQSEVIELLPPDKVVLEILETVSSVKELVNRCCQLKDKGYRFALDDFQGINYKNRDFLDVADIIKIDILGLTKMQIQDVVKQVQDKKAMLLAEKVETEDEFKFCCDLGFEYFQGFFFAKPEKIMKRKTLTANQVAVFQLLSMLRNESDIEKILEVFKLNPSLSVGMLRLCNSVAMGTRQKITSIRGALVYLGRMQLQRWLLLLLISNTADNQASQLAFAHLASSRGKLMESIALSKKEWQHLAGSAFIVGVVSTMGAFLEMDTKELIASMPLSDEVKEAIDGKKGILGNLLKVVENIERNGIAASAESLGIDKSVLARAQLESIFWVNTVVDSMTEDKTEK